MTRTLRRLAAASAALAFAGLTVAGSLTAAQAEDAAKISHIETDGSTINVLVSVPSGSHVDLSGVTATIDGVTVPAKATSAGESQKVKRTTILTIDTSKSMAGDRFTAAKAAANTFLETAPADVRVGIVNFAGTVEAPLAPTTDRQAAAAVIEGLQLSKQTHLYDGVLKAVDQAGSEGARTILLLSDGADTSETALEDATDAVTKSEVVLDVVSLGDGGDPEALQALATAGAGRVINSDPKTLRKEFDKEAQALARQVLVTVPIPDDITQTHGTVGVSLPTPDGTLTAQAFSTIRTKAAPVDRGPTPTDHRLMLPSWAVYPAVAVPALGLMALLFLMLVPTASKATASDRVSQYALATQPGKRAAERTEREATLAAASAAMDQVLNRNKSLEERIAGRLEAAGSKLKPSEWLLVHVGILAGATLLGLLLGRGSLITAFIFMTLGAILPWTYLGFRRNRRRKAFNSALPDTLQLMAGSLQAGLSLSQSVDTIVREGTEPIAGEFRRVLVETRLGVSLEDALEGITERFDSNDFAWVVMAIKIQRQVGGNLAELLTTVAGTMREREYVRRQVAALAAEGKLSAWVLGLLPPLFLLYLVLVNHDYVWPMFTTPLGWLMLLGGAVLLSVGVFWMSRLIKIEV